MTGGASQTGIEIVASSDTTPRLLLVEVSDTIERGMNKEVLELALGKAAQLGRWLRASRQEYQPVSVGVYALQSWRLARGSRVAPPAAADKTAARIASMRADAIARTVQRYNQPMLDDEIQVLRTRAEAMRARLAMLRSTKGLEVILFRTPIDAAVEGAARMRQVRGVLDKVFPPEQWRWLPTPPPPRQWLTGDGIHLTDAECGRYVGFIADELTRMGIWPTGQPPVKA